MLCSHFGRRKKEEVVFFYEEVSHQACSEVTFSLSWKSSQKKTTSTQ